MSLIAQFGPGLYRFGGALREARGSDNFKTFEGTARCRDDAGTLQFEGMYRYTGAMSLSHSFVVKMTSPPRSLADEIEVAAAPMGILRGHGLFVMHGAFEVLLTAPSGYAVAAHLNCSPGRHLGSRASSSSRRTLWALCLQLDPLRIAKLLRVSSIQTPRALVNHRMTVWR